MKIINKLSIGLVSCLICACDGFLDPKPDQGLLVPTTLEDMQTLLDNNNVFNKQANLPTISSDEFWTTSEAYAGMIPLDQGAYLWKDDPYQGESVWDWDVAYQQVFYANIVLEGLENYTGKEEQRAEELKGMALFYRSYAYFHLLQQFAQPFQLRGGNDQLLGIVLKPEADINSSSPRASLLSCYDQVVMDLELAISLLPLQNEFKTRPTKVAGMGLMAKTYLMMFDYGKAAEAAKSGLEEYGDRLDFNSLDVNAVRPFTRFSEETIFYSVLHSTSYTRNSQTYVDTLLSNTFEDDDLRVMAYYTESSEGLYNMVGHHTGNTVLFGGLSVGELQLIAAEGFTRTGDTEMGLKFLNDLLVSRYLNESWIPLEGMSEESLLERILLERRKELIGRGILWSDLRRLNQEERYEKTVIREIEGKDYLLEPNDLAYVFPIPDIEIQRSGIEQNPR